MDSDPDLEFVLSIMDCGDPARITQTLAVQPTSEYRRGSRSTEPIVLPRRNAWHCKTSIEIGADFETEAPLFLTKFAARKEELRSLVGECDVAMTIIVHDRCHFELPTELLTFCTDLGIPLRVDRY